MGKQSSVSLPDDMLKEIDKILGDYPILKKFGVDSRAKVVKLLANFGKTPLKTSLDRLKAADIDSLIAESESP